MFCGKCGTKNESGAKFCEKCGNKLEEPEKNTNKNKKEKESVSLTCEVCGAKNKTGAKFCEKCGHKLSETAESSKVKKENQTIKLVKDKTSKIPKKIKIGIGLAILLIVAAIIALAILLNNPVKKVEDYLTSYYNNYSEENDQHEELIEIGKILRNNKDNEDTLESISNQISKTLNNWVTNFNKSYKVLLI